MIHLVGILIAISLTLFYNYSNINSVNPKAVFSVSEKIMLSTTVMDISNSSNEYFYIHDRYPTSLNELTASGYKLKEKATKNISVSEIPSLSHGEKFRFCMEGISITDTEYMALKSLISNEMDGHLSVIDDCTSNNEVNIDTISESSDITLNYSF